MGKERDTYTKRQRNREIGRERARYTPFENNLEFYYLNHLQFGFTQLVIKFMFHDLQFFALS
jgi:hypothetical protein